MQTNHPSIAPNYFDTVGNLRAGNRDARPLLHGREGTPNNYRFNYSSGVEGGAWETPRHRHNFEQVRHPLEGDYSIGKDRVLPMGWVAYFPESTYYGPQALNANLRMATLQFGGPSGVGFWSMEQRARGFKELSQKGKFEGGIFSWVDEKGGRHNQDAGEAMWENLNHCRLEYPASRYADLILMNPAAFGWMKDVEQPGVARKNLGRFTERDIRIGFVRVEKGATVRLGGEPAPEIMFLKEGVIAHDGNSYPSLTAFGTEAAEAPVPLRAAEPCELLYLKLPTF